MSSEEIEINTAGELCVPFISAKGGREGSWCE